MAQASFFDVLELLSSSEEFRRVAKNALIIPFFALPLFCVFAVSALVGAKDLWNVAFFILFGTFAYYLWTLLPFYLFGRAFVCQQTEAIDDNSRKEFNTQLLANGAPEKTLSKPTQVILSMVSMLFLTLFLFGDRIF